jgi:hypothetical protein
MAKATQQAAQEPKKQIVIDPPQGDKPAEVHSQPQPATPPAPQPAPTASPTNGGGMGTSIELRVVPGVTKDNFTTFTKEWLVGPEGYGNISNAMRGLSALGVKNGPISKHLNKRFQHVRNVLKRELKRPIAEARAATPTVNQQPTETK